ncbi:MAG TPA: ABC transporter substrate-binding protein [bacterium]|nr:ABC transporter substrate-binding protein [bacterium]
MSDSDRDLLAKLKAVQVSRRAFLKAAATTAAGAAIASRAPTAQAQSAAPAALSPSSLLPSGRYGSETSGGTPKKGGTLIYGMEGPSDILDPQATGCWLTYRVTYQMFEGLITEDLTTIDRVAPPLVGRLAESWQLSDDKLTRTFKLRKGVKFSDGTDFDAKAALWNWQRMWDKKASQYYGRANSYCSYVVDAIKDVSVVDDYTLKMTFATPFAEWERMTVQSFGEPLMISPAQAQKLGNQNFAAHPAGTGPYKVAENVPNDHITLERFDGYWGPKPNADRLVFRQLDDPSTRVATLRKGEVDFILAPPPDSVAALRNEGYVVLASHAPHIWYFAFNLKDPIVGKDKRIREAIIMGVDRERMCSDLLKNTATAAYSMLSPATLAYDPSYKPYPYNPAAAKKLLAEAGYPNGFETTLETSTAGSGQMIPVSMIEWIQRDLKKIGVTAHIKTYEWVTYIGMLFKGRPAGTGASQLSWGMTSNYWNDIVFRSTRQPPNGVNYGFYGNPQVDKLLDQARSEFNDTARAALYRKADRIAMGQDVAFWPICNDLNIVVLNKKVRGFVNPPEEWFQLSTPWVAG